MNERNCRTSRVNNAILNIKLSAKNTYLEEGVLLLVLELVGTENLEAAGSLLAGKTLVVALEELEDVLDGDGLDVDLLLVVQVLGFELDLRERRQFDDLAALDAQD